MGSGQHIPANSTYESLCLDDEVAPSTNEDLRQAGFAPRDVLVSQSGLGSTEEKVGGGVDKLEICRVQR